MAYKSICEQQSSRSNFTDTALFQTKGHCAVTERVSEEKMVQNALGWQHINLGKHQHVVYIHMCLYLE